MPSWFWKTTLFMRTPTAQINAVLVSHRRKSRGESFAEIPRDAPGNLRQLGIRQTIPPACRAIVALHSNAGSATC
jgi:hypothetical protein